MSSKKKKDWGRDYPHYLEIKKNQKIQVKLRKMLKKHL